MRLILQSETYQRSSTHLPGNKDDGRFYSRFYPRRLKAEVMLDAISQVADVPSKFDGHDLGIRAIQLPDANTNSYFLKTFGRPDRIIACSCERTNEPTMVQVLHLSNGDTINEKLADKTGRVKKMLAARLSDEEIIRQIYQAALCRLPTEHELSQLGETLAQSFPNEKHIYVEDVAWGILSSREFLFNH